MKKLIALLLSLIMIFTLCIPAYANQNDEADNVSYSEISAIFGIPENVLESLPSDVLCQLGEDIDEGVSISSNESYLLLTTNEDGDCVAIESTYQEFLESTMLRNTDSNGWMRIYTTIIDNGNDAQVSASFTWLTRPAFRMKDVMGLSVTQGTFVENSASGFYSYSTSQGGTSTQFNSGFDYQGHGILHTVNLATPNYTVQSDFMFMKARIYKEGNSEGLNGCYAHQRASINFNPSFTISRNGIISGVGFSIGLKYDTFKGYASIYW